MDLNRVMLDVFRIAGLVLLFVLAVGIFLNIVGYIMIGGDAKKESDVTACKLAVSTCVNAMATQTSNCNDICLPCTGKWYDRCLIGDLSIFR